VKLKSARKIILFVILLTGLAGIIAGIRFYNLRNKNLLKEKPDFTITAEELRKEFESDEIASTSKFVNKIVEVTGVVSSIDKGENNALNVTLTTGSSLSSIICTFSGNTDTSGLKAGQAVTLRGECSGFLMDVLLNNCVLISK
jgi:hypothetical protein